MKTTPSIHRISRGDEKKMLRFLDSGESHGKALVAIVDGLLSNAYIDIKSINEELKRRQKGYGRGERMKIESDSVEIWSGINNGKTTGNPMTLLIFNKDYENWKDKEKEKIYVPRPGHGDLVGYFKYRTGDIRDTIERASARETAIRTAVGAVCKQVLLEIGVEIRSKVVAIGEITDEECDIFSNEVYAKIEKSPVRCYNKECEEKIIKEINSSRDNGDTIGGRVFISIQGVPLGIGSYTQWDKKLDGIISQSVISLQGIKTVEFGKAADLNLRGSSFNDAIYLHEEGISRMTNNCGGIEAGVSNGEAIEFNAIMKPIPSVKKPIPSVNLKTKENVLSRYERSDVCAVIPATVVLENICAFVILKEIMEKFNCDTMEELKYSMGKYRKELRIKYE